MPKTFNETLTPELAEKMLMFFREENREGYRFAIKQMSQLARVRDVFISKKPVKEQITWLYKQFQHPQAIMVLEHLCQVWLMEGQKDMLITFCEEMGFAHQQGTLDQELPEELPADKVDSAVEELLANYDQDLIIFYLEAFNAQRENGWDTLTAAIEKIGITA